MTNNAYEFEKFLKKSNINAEFEDTGNGETFCKMQQKLKCGPTVRIVIVFDKNEDLVSIYSFDYVNLSNPSKDGNVYKLLNQLNTEYAYFKFSMDNKNNIIISYFLPFKNNFNADVIMQILIGMIQVMDNEYEGFMNVIK